MMEIGQFLGSYEKIRTQNDKIKFLVNTAFFEVPDIKIIWNCTLILDKIPSKP